MQMVSVYIYIYPYHFVGKALVCVEDSSGHFNSSIKQFNTLLPLFITFKFHISSRHIIICKTSRCGFGLMSHQ